jgi:hypothetical protein
LDNILHDLFKVSAQQQFSAKLFREIAQNYIKAGVDKQIAAFIDQGRLIPLEGVFKFRPEGDDKIEVWQIKQSISRKEKRQFNEFFSIK